MRCTLTDMWHSRPLSRLVLLALATITAGSPLRSAWAYIPPANFMLRTLAKKHKSYRQIVIRSTVSAPEGGTAGGLRFREETVFFPASGVLKSWAMDEQGNHLYETEARGKSVAPASALLFEASIGQLEADLRGKGIPVLTANEYDALANEQPEPQAAEPAHLAPERARESKAAAPGNPAIRQAHPVPEKTFMTRWNSSTVWVIGADDPKAKATVPQVWLEKDTFLPLRLLASPGLEAGGELGDARFENYRYSREFPYPRTIFFYHAPADKQPVLRDDLNDLIVDGGSDLSRAKVGQGFTPAGESAAAPLHELIRSYYNMIR